MATTADTSVIRLFPAFTVRKAGSRFRKRRTRPLSTIRPAPRSLTPLDRIQCISRELDEVTAEVDKLQLRIQPFPPREKPLTTSVDMSLDALYRRSFHGPLIAANLYSRSTVAVPWMRHRRRDSQTLVLSL